MKRVRRFLGGEKGADLLLWFAVSVPVFFTDQLPDPQQVAVLPLPWVKVAAVPLLTLAVLVARRMPLAAAAVPPVLGLAATPELSTDNFLVAQLLLAYLLGRRAAGQRAALLLFAAVAAAGLLLVLVLPSATATDGFAMATYMLMTLVAPWLAGRYARLRDELVRTGWELAERLEREQELVGDRVRLHERSRIATDMHDSLGHELSMIALRAAALQVRPGLDEPARRAAGELRQTAAAVTERLREVIGVLQDDGESAPVRPAGDTVESLVERAAESGVAMKLIDGPAPEGAAEPLPPMVDRAIYRVVQEALTNATRHAPGAAVTVTVRRERTEAVVAVVNEAPPNGRLPAPRTGSGGYGLVGLDERVRLAGGTLRARPVDGGFAVTARLPLTAGAAASPPGAAEGPRRGLALARRKVRRNMLDTIWLPLAAAAVLLGLIFGLSLDTPNRSVLYEEDYERLRIGQRQSSVENRLPAQPADDERVERAAADPPRTDECRFYRAWPDVPSPVYRLCFTDGRLSHKDKVDLGD